MPEDVAADAEQERLYKWQSANRALEHVAARQMQRVHRKQHVHRAYVAQIFAIIVLQRTARRVFAVMLVRRVRR